MKSRPKAQDAAISAALLHVELLAAAGEHPDHPPDHRDVHAGGIVRLGAAPGLGGAVLVLGVLFAVVAYASSPERAAR
jgi:hypothetical protein